MEVGEELELAVVQDFETCVRLCVCVCDDNVYACGLWCVRCAHVRVCMAGPQPVIRVDTWVDLSYLQLVSSIFQHSFGP
jgi:hypothetical protein